MKRLHPWDLTPAEARALQKDLADQVVFDRPIATPRLVAAADVSMLRGDPNLYAAVVVVELPSMDVVERVSGSGPVAFPYVPGLLSFREAPALLEAFAKLTVRPEVVLCDGQGRAHPRRLGIASHLGLWLGLPTIGCAKSRLCGSFREPGPMRGDRSHLVDRGETVGAVLRTRDRVAPLFVSPGHLCDLESAVRIVLECGRGRRLPEPARLAHEVVNTVRKAAGQVT